MTAAKPANQRIISRQSPLREQVELLAVQEHVLADHVRENDVTVEPLKAKRQVFPAVWLVRGFPLKAGHWLAGSAASAVSENASAKTTFRTPSVSCRIRSRSTWSTTSLRKASIAASSIASWEW